MNAPELGRKIELKGFDSETYHPLIVTGVVTRWPRGASLIELDGKRTRIPRYDVSYWRYVVHASAEAKTATA
jgi:hypothetical protein